MRITLTILCSMAIGLFSVTALAQDGTQQDDKAALRGLYDKAIDFYNAGKPGDAAQAFRELMIQSQRYEYAFNVGECEIERGRFDLAYEAFTMYLEHVGEKAASERRERAEKVIAESSIHIGFVNVQENESLEVWVDDEHRSETPLSGPIAVLPGEHAVRLKNGGDIVFETTINITQRQTVDVARIEEKPKAEMSKSGPIPVLQDKDTQLNAPPEILNTNSPRPGRSPLKTTGIITTAIGGALLATAIVTGRLAVSKGNKMETNCPDKDLCSDKYENTYDTGKSLAKATNILLITGGAITLTGVILTIAGHKRAKSDKLTKVNTLPVLGSNMAGVSIQGSF
ncbi:MAG: tetratricopeptide repeat protein [Deltaproteobacteria bacterium]|nr:tetratricopeptide repeat protein [Deltaproteobacteria bacterium]